MNQKWTEKSIVYSYLPANALQLIVFGQDPGARCQTDSDQSEQWARVTEEESNGNQKRSVNRANGEEHNGQNFQYFFVASLRKFAE